MKKLLFILIIVSVVFSMQILAAAEQIDSSGTYNFVSVDSGRYMNVYAGIDKDGTKLVVWDKDNSNEQNFELISLGNSKYALRPHSSSSRRVDVNRGNSYSNPLKAGLVVDIWQANDPDAQAFYFVDKGNNLYAIELVALSGHVLTVGSGGSNGTGITLQGYSGGNNQLWKIYKNNTQITKPVATPTPTPKITTPAPGAFNTYVKSDKFTTTADIVLNWNTSANATSYGITVSKEPYGAGNAVFDRDGVTGNSINIGRLPVGKYRYNMIARNATGNSPLSNTSYFTVEEPQVTNIAPGFFSVTTSKLQYTSTETISLSWSISENSKSYDFAVFKGNDVVISKSDLTSNYADIGVLPPGNYTIYINAVNGNHETTALPVDFAVVNAVEKKAYVVNTGGLTLRIRSTPEIISSNIIGTFRADEEITVVGEITNGFYKVNFNGGYGYSSAAFISFNKPVHENLQTPTFDPVWPTPDTYLVYVLNYYFGTVVKGIHPTKNYDNYGAMDIAGTGNVIAIEDGIITEVVNNVTGFLDQSWGNYVVIKHNDGKYSFYSHLKHNSIKVAVNSSVKKGQKIAEIGSTGTSTGNHLHFEIWNSNKSTLATWTFFRDKYKSQIKYDGDIVTGGSNPQAWRDWIKNNYNLVRGIWTAK